MVRIAQEPHWKNEDQVAFSTGIGVSEAAKAIDLDRATSNLLLYRKASALTSASSK